MSVIQDEIDCIKLSIKQLNAIVNAFPRYQIDKDTDFYRTKLTEYNNAVKSLRYEKELLKSYQYKYPECFM